MSVRVPASALVRVSAFEAPPHRSLFDCDEGDLGELRDGALGAAALYRYAPADLEPGHELAEAGWDRALEHATRLVVPAVMVPSPRAVTSPARSVSDELDAVGSVEGLESPQHEACPHPATANHDAVAGFDLPHRRGQVTNRAREGAVAARDRNGVARKRGDGAAEIAEPILGAAGERGSRAYEDCADGEEYPLHRTMRIAAADGACDPSNEEEHVPPMLSAWVLWLLGRVGVAAQPAGP